MLSSLLMLAGLGAFHGLNPGMGWLFAVALGMQEGRRNAVWFALLPLTLGHTLAIAATIIVASVAGFLVSDYLFYPPYYSLAMDDPREVVDLLLFLFVALVTGDLASRLKREADALRESKKELGDLYDFSRRLAACFTASDLVFAIQAYLTNTLERSVFLISAAGDNDLERFDDHSAPEQVRGEAAAMIAEHVEEWNSEADRPGRHVNRYTA